MICYFQGMEKRKSIKVGMAQIAPAWLNKKANIKKIEASILEAADQSCDLVVFGEGILPGYPFWLSFTHSSAFENKAQKEIHAHYVDQSICIEEGDLDSITTLAKKENIAIYLGIIERPLDRGGHSLYCSLVFIDKEGVIQSVHRKMRPTYEERLAWSAGDGHGLKTHPMELFRLGGLNCWENWMPLSRAALYGQGENVHVAVWPGNLRNTQDITRFIALESRSYVISVSGLFSKALIHESIPHYDLMRQLCPDIPDTGGSCIAAPDGTWLIEPIIQKEGLFCAELDIMKIYEERQNMDPAGHYSRPDVTQLNVNRARQSIIE